MDDDSHRYQSSDEEDFQESVDKAVEIFTPTLTWTSAAPTSTPKVYSTLLIGSAFAGSSLLHAIPNKTLVARFSVPTKEAENNDKDKEAALSVNCNIYELASDPSVALIPCNIELKDKDILNFSKVILNNVQAKRIVVLDTLSPSTFVGGTYSDAGSTLLRILQTTGSAPVPAIATLEVPNLVQSLGAGVLGYCEVRGIKDVYLLLSLQEHVYGKSITTRSTLLGLIQGMEALQLQTILQSLSVDQILHILEKGPGRRSGPKRVTDDRLYA